MGCCFSSTAGSSSSFPDSGPNASSRRISSASLNRSERPGSQTCSTRRRRRDTGALDQHIDKPLRRHEWTSKDRRWTRSQLDAERAAFFDTRVTGRPEIWQTIRAALSVLTHPDTDDDAAEIDGLATAQSILSAAEISLPTGDLVNGAYDSLGNFYQMHAWLVADPTNLAHDDEDHDDDSGDDAESHRSLSPTRKQSILRTDHDDDAELSSSDSIDKRRREKGKAVLDMRDHLSVRARLSDSGRDVNVSVRKSDAGRTVIRAIVSESALPPSKKIRLAYMGKMLRDDLTLESQGWQTGHVINALVFPR
ncbi:hypothetical protein CDD82_4194 [Ophiocordyceps australis]|uniref:Ubiquitin-like domain-containing protein n=1 Tax=Ophiocordyceps australis TaxID=1399860 RepID=A0A2C5XL83_9HYPO|nr:hypothetical protein CDD82_4194 [Ophiocordyceps australis]